MTGIRLNLLGSIELTSACGNQHRDLLAQPKRVALLAYLALAGPGTFVRKDTLAALFWPECDSHRARRSLRQSLYVLRKALGRDAFESFREEVRIAPDSLTVDVRDFEEAARSGRWSRALELWRGDLMVGFFVTDAAGFERWLDSEQARLRQVAWETFFEAAEASADEDRTMAIRFAHVAAELRPMHEPTARLLMRLQAGAGDRDAARATYARLEQELAAAFGTVPEASSRELFEVLTFVSPSRPGQREPWLPEPAPIRGMDEWSDRDSDPDTSRWMSRLPRMQSRHLAAIALMLLAALTYLDGSTPFRAEAKTPARPPTIAALPFHTLGEDTGQREMATELHHRLIHVLERATDGGLRVISRQSVLGYAATTSPDVIGRDLSVDYLVSGTLQIHGRGEAPPLFELLIELTRIDSGAVLWSQRFEDELLPDELVAVQAAAMDELGRNLLVAIREDGVLRLARAGTSDREAYDLFLRALELGAEDALPLLRAAVERAPEFMLAQAQLARVLGEVHQYGERTDETAAAALSHARRALEIDPHAPDAVMSMAWAHYRTRDWEGAQAWLAQARGSLRSEHQYLVLSAYVNRRLYRFDEALELLERAIELKPNSRSLQSQHAQTLFVLRRYQEAIPFYEAGGERPENLARSRWYLTGDMKHLEHGVSVDSDFLRWDAAMYAGDWTRAERLLSRLPDIRRDQGAIWQPRALLEAWVHEAAGRPAEAAAAYVRAEAETRSRLIHAPSDARALSTLAVIHAGLGDAALAVREAEAAVEMTPPRQDLVEGPHHLFHLAAVLARAGRLAEATEVVEQLLSTPSMYNALRVEQDYLMRPLGEYAEFRTLVEREKGRVF